MFNFVVVMIVLFCLVFNAVYKRTNQIQTTNKLQGVRTYERVFKELLYKEGQSIKNEVTDEVYEREIRDKIRTSEAYRRELREEFEEAIGSEFTHYLLDPVGQDQILKRYVLAKKGLVSIDDLGQGIALKPNVFYDESRWRVFNVFYAYLSDRINHFHPGVHLEFLPDKKYLGDPTKVYKFAVTLESAKFHHAGQSGYYYWTRRETPIIYREAEAITGLRFE